MREHNSGRDHELDSALASYAAVEPRPGLEQRVLANLRANRQFGGAQNAWRSPVLALLVVAVAIAVASSGWLMKTRKSDSPEISNPMSPRSVAGVSQPPVSVQMAEGQMGQKSAPPVRQAHAGTNRLAAKVRLPAQTEAEVAPKLAQFPAPEPLSEQEKLLVRFVQYDPREAELVAEERAEQLQHEREEMNQERGEAEGSQQ